MYKVAKFPFCVSSTLQLQERCDDDAVDVIASQPAIQVKSSRAKREEEKNPIKKPKKKNDS